MCIYININYYHMYMYPSSISIDIHLCVLLHSLLDAQVWKYMVKLNEAHLQQ